MITLCKCGAIAYGSINKTRGKMYKHIRYVCSKCFKAFWEDRK